MKKDFENKGEEMCRRRVEAQCGNNGNGTCYDWNCCNPGCCCCCGPAGPAPEDVFAAFATFAVPFANGSRIPLGTVTADPTGQIVLSDSGDRITLAPGYYMISYHVSSLLAAAGYMQITPFYSGASHIEYGIYFMTGAGRTSAYGSNSIIIQVPETTRFSLTFNSNVVNTEGTATITVLKLNRGEQKIPGVHAR